MTNIELKQLRQLLFFSVKEAAEFIGNCEPRSWQRWEDGTRKKIPHDVINTLQMLALKRAEMLKYEFDKINPNYQYFETFKEFKAAGGGGNELFWCLAQSVSSQLVSEQEAEKWRQEETITHD